MRPRIRKPSIRVVAGVARRGRRVLAALRPEGKPYPGFWEFPGGKVEEGESDAEALRREFREELGVEAAVGSEIASYTHEYPEKIVELHFLEIVDLGGEPSAIGVAEIRWVGPVETGSMPFLEGDRKFLEGLRASPPRGDLNS
ncbi:MAG: (deoxy)nucleoside triphosphate pyrophosphohydrolase [Candidatus Eisenbacteria bacterium]